MWRACAATFLLSCSFAMLHAQNQKEATCSTPMDYEPVLVDNHAQQVTFKCVQATPLELIQAVGRQTRIPIGIVFGRDANALTKERHSYDLENVTPETALQEAAHDADYTLNQEGAVWVLVADDLSSRQSSLLLQTYSDFNVRELCTLVELGVSLTMWMQAAANPKIQGFGGSILHSLNDERLTLKVPPSSNTEEIANAIVSLGSKGMWMLKAAPDSPNDALNDQVEIEPYQHYSNRPNVQ